MNAQLAEVNEIFLQVQDCLYPTYEHVIQMTEEERRWNNQNYQQFKHSLEIFSEKLNDLYPKLSPDEVIEGYNEGCRLLQMRLSGYMGQYFHSAYIPLMMHAVKSPHQHTAWVFLQVLARTLEKEIAPLVIEALEKNGVRESALSVVSKLELKEAIPKINEIMDDLTEYERYLAEQTLVELRK